MCDFGYPYAGDERTAAQEEMKKREIDLPIIFLTGHGDIDMAVKALLTGATDFIVKPPEPNRLKEARR